MNKRILFVDDEPNVLEAIRRQLRSHFDIETAVSGIEALYLISASEPFAVIISDMRMPNMSGSEFLRHVKDASPDSVRLILSGQSDVEDAIAAVNDGHIFRFLTKPCSPGHLLEAIHAGVRQYSLIVSEREILGQTLDGSIRMMTEIIGLASPEAAEKADRIRSYAEQMGTELGIDHKWQFRLATRLSQIGAIALPQETLAKLASGAPLSEEERALQKSHHEITAKLVSNIPRMNPVAEIIANQNSPQDLGSLPNDLTTLEIEHLSSVVLWAAIQLDNLILRGNEHNEAVRYLCEDLEAIPDQLATILKGLPRPATRTIIRRIGIDELTTGMVLEEDVLTPSGVCLLKSGQEVTETHLIRLKTAAQGVGIAEPFAIKEVIVDHASEVLKAG